MEMPTRKLLRCAIYTRKSTEHNLDLEFNSLDAQREACEAYIKSQAHEGWRLVPHHYDDGAFSGASLDRPALQALLSEVRAGKIDIIVVYKVDRLTRSLADFAKLVDLFDQHSVSFVSVTQSFNTTSSMGRLTLNVLLSFAQFEREVIGERVRDKIAASRRRGIWTGGPVALGYASINKKLLVVSEEAERVRLIFQRYLEVGSIGALVQDLDRRRIRTKRQQRSDGKVRGGIRFGVGHVAYLLRNRLYVGEVVYRGAVHPGEHEAIVDQALFEAVQAKLAATAVDRQLRIKGSSAILAGRIFDDRGNRMTPTHSNKQGARYRYYVSHALLQKRNGEAGSLPRVPAHEVETLVINSLPKRLDDANGEGQKYATDRETVDRQVERIIIKRGAIDIHLINGPDSRPGHRQPDENKAPTPESALPPILTVPWTSVAATELKGILHSPSEPTMTPESRDALLYAIAKARAWIEDLVGGRVASFAEIATQEGKVEDHVRFLARLAFASPRVVSAIIDGSVPADSRVTAFAKGLVYHWREQERRLGIANA
jgi:DNA invertase Pin-like site-specific DNA recombinase